MPWMFGSVPYSYAPISHDDPRSEVKKSSVKVPLKPSAMSIHGESGWIEKS